MTSRKYIYDVINTERDYQDQKWGKNNEDKVADWLLYIEKHLNDAKDLHYNSNTESVMSEIRKVAALCVASAEQFGLPERRYDDGQI